MQAPDPIEAALARLMPVAFSDSGLRAIEESLDELADLNEALPAQQTTTLPGPTAAPRKLRFLIPSTIAASIAALLALLPGSGPTTRENTATEAPATSPGLILVSESERIESMTDEGWLSDPDGSAMQAVRIRTIGENQLRDEETGIEFRVTEPREEILLMPVSSF
jgi:hypothetical protein